MAQRRSPIRVRCRRLLFGIKSCAWTCERPLRGAEFTHRRDNRSAIVVPSTKGAGWQVTTFDAAGPIGDRQYPNCAEALRELSPKLWRLRRVE